MFHELLGLKHYLSDRTELTAVLLGVDGVEPPFVTFTNNPHQSPAPAELGWFLHKGLHKDPSQRYASAAEMVERLRARADGRIPVQCHITFSKRSSREFIRFIDRHPLLFTAGLGVTVLGGITLGILRLLGH